MNALSLPAVLVGGDWNAWFTEAYRRFKDSGAEEVAFTVGLLALFALLWTWIVMRLIRRK